MYSFMVGIAEWKILILEILVAVVTVCIIVAIFKIKQHQIQMERLENHDYYEFQQGLNGINAFIALLDEQNLQVRYCTKNAKRFLGIHQQEVERNILAALQTVENKYQRKIKEEYRNWKCESILSIEFPFQVLHGEGKQQHGRLNMKYLPQEGAYLLLVEDITGEYQTRTRLMEHLNQAKLENQSKTQFLSQMSHEIRTPMNGILGLLALSRMDLKNTSEVEASLIKAEELSKFLLGLINDVLDMSRIESGRLELEEKKFDIFAFSDKIRTMFEKNIEERNIKFTLEMEDFDVRYLIGDELRLSQVIVNFLSNAQKFTSAGGVSQ